MIGLCRFRTDAADLEFIEKVARWLTNTQVQIKTEVASSNTQCQAIDQSVNKLQYLLSSDRQSDGSQDDVVMDTLRSLFELVHGRAAYLRCLDEAGTRRRGTEVNRSSVQNEAAAAAARTTILQFLLWHQERCKVLRSLWPPYGIGQAIIFLPCGFFLSIFLIFPRLISASAATDQMSTILPHMVCH